MKILLVDVDSKIPNIALMKISWYYKNKGDNVDLHACKMPYYPNRKKNEFIIPKGYDKVYCSVIFIGNHKYIKQNNNNIEFGGTGFSLKKKLPEYIESCDLDYSIYDGVFKNDVSYGFISRGCIRKCSFCFVPKKEGKIHQVQEIKDIVKYGHKKVKFLDNNFLALPNHEKILEEIIQKKIKCQFNQGLDIRLINIKNSELLSKLNYIGEYIFAFDNYKLKNRIDEKLKILQWRKAYQFKFFVYVSPDMKISETVNRVKYLKAKKILPYIMRDISCWNSKYKNFYIDLAAYCNQPSFFKKINFETFLNKRHKNKKRIEESCRIYMS